MNMRLLCIVGFGISLMTTHATIGFGHCQDYVEPVGNFSATNYTGTWYEIFRDSTVPYELNSECVTATYTYDINNDPWPITVCNRADGGDCNILAKAQFDSEGNGHVKFNFYPEGNYQVLDTDYVSFSLVYGCDQWLSRFFPIYTQQAWILARDRTLDQETIDRLEQVLEDKVGDFYDWDSVKLQTEQGDDCTYVF